MLPSTEERVPHSTANHVNEEIHRRTRENIERCSQAGPEAIEARLEELDREWDIERALEANAAIATMTGVALGAALDRRFFWFPGIIGAFLLQHAMQGWCPPVPIMRRLGFRTQSEIDEEKYALKALRGDFRKIDRKAPIERRDRIDTVLAAVEK